MSNTSGTPGGVGSSQGGQQGWEDGNQAQPIPPSKEGTTSVLTSPEEEQAMTKAKTDKEREAEEALGTDAPVAPTEEATTSTDPADQPNFGLPEGVSTSQTRGENKDAEGDTIEANPEGEPNPTVEEQLGTAPEDEDEGLKEG